MLFDVFSDDGGDVFNLPFEFRLFFKVVLGLFFDELFVLFFLVFEQVLFFLQNLNLFEFFSDRFHVFLFEVDHFFEVLKQVVQRSEVFFVFGFVFRTEFEDYFESFFLEETFAEVVDHFLFFPDEIFEDFVFFVLLFVFMFVE